MTIEQLRGRIEQLAELVSLIEQNIGNEFGDERDRRGALVLVMQGLESLAANLVNLDMDS